MRHCHLTARFVAAIGLAASFLLGTSSVARAETDLPTLNLVLKSFVDTGSDQITSPGAPNINGTARYGGSVVVPLNGRFKHLSLNYDHDNAVHTEARVTSGGAYSYPGDRYDQIDRWFLGYNLGPALSFDLGYYYKHRVCCPAASDPTNTRPSSEHAAYLTTAANLGPKRYGVSLINASVTGWRSINHQFGPVTAGYSNQGDLYLYSSQIRMQTSIDRNGVLQPYVGASISNDYYNNRPVPYYFHSVKMGVQSRLSSRVSLSADLSNLSEFNEGYPYTFPNTIHYTLLTLQATIHIPLAKR